MPRNLATAAILAAAAGAAHGQPVVGGRESVALDSPEGWAMARTTAATLNLGPLAPAAGDPWQLSVTGELASIPHVDREDTRVGLGGTKFEDLNRSPVFGRLRLRLGLPADFTAELAWSPPVEIDGVRPDGIYGLALERPLYARERWSLGARLFAQAGHAEGDITCSAGVVEHPPGSAGNPFGCRARSDDDIELDHGGIELFGSLELDGGRWQPFASLALTRIEPEVQVNARVFGVVDRTQLVTGGNLRTGTLGVAYRSSKHWQWTAAFSYTPLDVHRPPESNRESDDFWSLRLGLSWRFR